MTEAAKGLAGQMLADSDGEDIELGEGDDAEEEAPLLSKSTMEMAFGEIAEQSVSVTSTRYSARAQICAQLCPTRGPPQTSLGLTDMC